MNPAVRRSQKCFVICGNGHGNENKIHVETLAWSDIADKERIESNLIFNRSVRSCTASVVAAVVVVIAFQMQRKKYENHECHATLGERRDADSV